MPVPKLNALDRTRVALATAYMNQGIDWDDACNQVETFEHNCGATDDWELRNALYLESCRYEDM